MVLSIKKAAGAGYYFQGMAHVAHTELAGGIWLQGNSSLGVNEGQPIEKRSLDRLLRRRAALTGLMPTFSLKDGSSGYDLVFSVPKSISIAWALGGAEQRKEIEAAHHHAVVATVQVLCEEAIKERVGKGGRQLRTADAVVAAFLHSKCRPGRHQADAAGTTTGDLFPDPNLHTHVVIPDIVVGRRAEVAPTFRSLKIAYTTLYGRWAMALGAWYHAALAHELRIRGLQLKSAGGNGLFTLADFNSSWTIGFSSRTEGSRNLFPDRPRTIGFEKSRAKQIDIEEERLEEIWREHAKRLGVDVEAALSALGAASAILTEGLERAGRNGQVPPRALSAAEIREIVGLLDRNEAVIQRQDIFRAVASFLVEKSIPLAPSAAMVAQVIQSDLLEELAPTESYGFAQWTTLQNLRTEDEVRRLVDKLDKSFFEPAQVSGGNGGSGVLLAEEQRDAVELLAGNGKLGVLIGGPGTGKTTLLEPVIHAYQAQIGRENVIGVAEAWLQALQLKARFGIPAYSLESLLHHARTGALGLQTKKTVLVVDEAGLLSSARMRDVLDLAYRFDVKLILLGDSQQLDPIGAGSGLKLARTARNVARLSEIKRQKPGTSMEIAESFAIVAEARNNAEAGFDIGEHRHNIRLELGHLGEKLAETRYWRACGSSRDAVDRIAEELVAARMDAQSQGQQVRALVRSHREALHLTRQMRKTLRKKGLITGEDVELQAVTPMGQTYLLRLAKGDHVRFLIRSDALGVYNGTEGYVTDVGTGADPVISVRLAEGTVESVGPSQNTAPPGEPWKQISFRASSLRSPDDSRVRLACGYAMTIYGSQGATFDRVLILKSSRMTFRELYVAATRAREAFTVFENNAGAQHLEEDVQFRGKLGTAIARELMAMERRDHGKSLASEKLRLLGDDEKRRINTEKPEPAIWEWHVIAEDVEAFTQLGAQLRRISHPKRLPKPANGSEGAILSA